MSRFFRVPICLAAVVLGMGLQAVPANAQPDRPFHVLSANEELSVVNNKAYVPNGLGITDTYVQDFPPQGLEVLLCYNAAFKPLMLPKAQGAWMAMQGTGGVGMGTYVYQYPNAKAAKSAGQAMLATSCAARGDDPKAGLQQSQRKLPSKSGSPGLLITSSYLDDGELQTNQDAYRQVGLAILRVGAVYNGGPDSATGSQVRTALTKILDQLTANYVKAATS